MLQVIFSAFIILLATVGCHSQRYVDYFPYHDDGCPKPHVVLFPVTDGCQSQLPWDVAAALTQGIHYQLVNSGELYVLSPKEIGPAWENRGTIDFFGSDLSFAREFCDADFLIGIELIEDGTTPCEVCVDSHSYHQGINMRVRLRIIDVRRSTPRNIVFEIVKTDYVLTPSCSRVDYNTCRSFGKTPCGIVQQRMINTLSKRLEEVIECAR